MEINTGEKNKFCRLCFQYCDNFEVLKDEANKMLKVLLFQPDFNIADKQIICTDCSGNIKKSFNFKSSCLNIENYIKSITNSGGDSKVNLNEIFVNRTDKKEFMNLSESCAVCRLCMKLVQDGCWAPLNEEINNGTLKMLKQYLPELDLNITQNPIICMSCKVSLEDYFGFIKKCLEYVEEKHFGDKEKCVLDQNESKPNSHFTIECNFIHEDCGTEFKCQEGGNTNEMEFNNKTLMDIEIQEVDIEEAEIDIKSENANFSRNDNEKNYFLNENAAMPKSRNSLFNCKLCSYSTNRKTKLRSHMNIHQNVPPVMMYNCQICPFTTKYKSNLSVHMKIHRDPSEVMIYHCKTCKYKTKYKADLKKHSLIHEYTYSCNKCGYKSNTQYDLDLHTLVHNEAAAKPTETVYSCEVCPYQTRYKSALTKHRITHLDMTTHKSLKFQCEDCKFQTNRKKELEKHSLLHLSVAETEIFQCAYCKFITKYKGSFKNHMVLHQNVSLMKMYQCDVCNFKTRHERYIDLHALTHRDPSERKMYACDVCDYKALHKRHMLRHKSKKHGVGKDK